MTPSPRLPAPVFWTGLWLLACAAAVWARPPLPVDETRYLAVAWEMWRDGNFLVPHLNGETYSHKPPLLFWLMQAGWTVFGVVEWWPRLVAPLFGLASLFLTAKLARQLWPGRRDIDAAAPLFLFGAAFWALYTTLTMFDMMLAAFALLGLLGVAESWRTGSRRGFVLLGVAIGLGVLAKGPAILLHLMPVALSAPWWGGAPPSRGWKWWYGGVGAAFLLGAAIGLAWAVPAGIAGGLEYRKAIFWGQSAGRMVESFAHNRPWWWYLAITPPLLFPWVLWPRMWRAMREARTAPANPGVRFCVAWFVPAFALFSLISGKQVHYLLPEFPALALLGAFVLAEVGERPRDAWPPALLLAMASGAFSLLHFAYRVDVNLPLWSYGLDALWMLAPLAAGLVAARMGGLAALSAMMAVAVAAIHLAAVPILANSYDLGPLSQRIGEWEREGRPIANYGKYHGQFHFLGRLENPVAVIGDGETPDWVAKNPNGLIVSYQRKVEIGEGLVLVQPFRKKYITVWEASAVADNLELPKRGP